MNGGKPRKPAEVKQAAGTARPDRSMVIPFPGVPIDNWVAPEMPTWLSPAARKIWARRVAVYERRGQDVSGDGDILALYVDLLAEIADMRRRKIEVPVARHTAARLFAAEFFDTSAARGAYSTKGAQAKGNKFARNGRFDDGERPA